MSATIGCFEPKIMDERATFRVKLQEHVSRTFNVTLSSLNGVEQSKKMARFYITEVLCRTDPQLVPDDEEDLDFGLVDGPNDGGVDFISRQSDTVLIVQCKYHGKKGEPRPDEFSHFRDVLNRLHKPEPHRLRRELLENLTDID